MIGSKIERFNAKLRITPSCWLWQAGKRRGYGYFSVDRQSVGAHRFSYEYFIGKIPAGYVVCHRCDTPSCVNPDHLFIGTPADNSADMIRKGRQSRIRTKGNTRLPQSIIDEVRHLHELGLSCRGIAAKCGISVSHAHNVAKKNKRNVRYQF